MFSKPPSEDSSERSASTEYTAKEMEEAKMRQRSRKEVLEKVCANVQRPSKDSPSWKSTINSLYRHFQVAPEYSLMNCWVHKAGSTPWNCLMGYIYHREDLIEAWESWKMEGVLRPEVSEFERILGDPSYRRLLYTREPLSRVLSAYNQRIFQDPPSSQAVKHIPKILKKTRPTKTYSQSEMIHTNGSFAIKPSFDEFVEYIVASTPEHSDSHWIPVFDQCGVCFVNYTHIVLGETFLEDIKLIMRESGIDVEKYISVLEDNSNKNKNIDTSAAMARSYATLSPSTLQKLINMYKYDFIIFGYSPTEFLKNIYPDVTFKLE